MEAEAKYTVRRTRGHRAARGAGRRRHLAQAARPAAATSTSTPSTSSASRSTGCRSAPMSSMRGIKVGRVEDYALHRQHQPRARADPHRPAHAGQHQHRGGRQPQVRDRHREDRPGNPGSAGPAADSVPPNEHYPVIPEGTSNLDEIANRLNKVGETAAETLERLNEVLKPENRAAIDKTLANLRDLTGGLNQRLVELDRTLKAVQGAASGLGRASNSVTTLADNARPGSAAGLAAGRADDEGHLGRDDRAGETGRVAVAGGRLDRQLERRPANGRGRRTQGDRRDTESAARSPAGSARRAARPVERRNAALENEDGSPPPHLALVPWRRSRCGRRLHFGRCRQGHQQQAQFRIVDAVRRRRPRCTPNGRAAGHRAAARRSGRRLLRAGLFARAQPACRLSVRDMERPAIEPPGSCWSIASPRDARSPRSTLAGAESPVTCSSISGQRLLPRCRDIPGTARVEVSAELIDRGTRKLIARQTFSATAPVAQANSAAAAAALSGPVASVLDQLTAWVEAKAAPATLAPRAERHARRRSPVLGAQCARRPARALLRRSGHRVSTATVTATPVRRTSARTRCARA